MSKTFLFKFIIGAAFVVAFLFWILSITVEDTFGWFNLAWAVALVAGAWGVAFLFRGLFPKNVGMIKKFYVYFGVGLLTIAFIMIAPAVIPGEDDTVHKILWPVIGLAISVALLLGMIAVGGKKWDQGDNKNVGYKNYEQRKKEEAKDKEAQKLADAAELERLRNKVKATNKAEYDEHIDQYGNKTD